MVRFNSFAITYFVLYKCATSGRCENCKKALR